MKTEKSITEMTEQEIDEMIAADTRTDEEIAEELKKGYAEMEAKERDENRKNAAILDRELKEPIGPIGGEW